MIKQVPNYGNENVFSITSPVYIQEWTGDIIEKPNSEEDVALLFNGTQTACTISFTGDSVTGDKIYFRTTESLYLIYCDNDGGSIYDVGVLVNSELTASKTIEAIVEKLNKYSDLVISYTTSTLTITSKMGGLTETPSNSWTNATLTNAISGTGDWGKIGKVHADISVNLESLEVGDSEKEVNQTGAKIEVMFDLMNVSERALNIASQWNNRNVNIAFFDETNSKYPVAIHHNLLMTSLPDLMNKECARVKFRGTKQYKSWENYIKFFQAPYDNISVNNNIMYFDETNQTIYYHHDNIIDEFEITEADITLNDAVTAIRFQTIKDSNDNCYLFVGRPQEWAPGRNGRIIKISSTGIKTYVNLAYDYSPIINSVGYTLTLTKDENNIIYATYGNASDLIPVSEFASSITTEHTYNEVGIQFTNCDWRMYKNLYFWKTLIDAVAITYIYNYTTKLEIDSIAHASPFCCMCVSIDNIAYVATTTTIEKTELIDDELVATVICTSTFDYAKQIVIDAWGDLIILSNDGTDSSIKKYDISGTLIDTITLTSELYYNLNTGVDGKYYYSNEAKTYEIQANTAQGQAFNASIEINDNGSIGYNNNITGYNPNML